jgi:hypothetical protein
LRKAEIVLNPQRKRPTLPLSLLLNPRPKPLPNMNLNQLRRRLPRWLRGTEAMLNLRRNQQSLPLNPPLNLRLNQSRPLLPRPRKAAVMPSLLWKQLSLPLNPL